MKYNIYIYIYIYIIYAVRVCMCVILVASLMQSLETNIRLGYAMSVYTMSGLKHGLLSLSGLVETRC